MSVNDWLLGNIDTGRPFHRDSLQADYLKPMSKYLGIKDPGWHAFRHTYRSLLRDLELPIEIQQHLMRHASIVTTLKYGRKGPHRAQAMRQGNAQLIEMLPAMGGEQEMRRLELTKGQYALVDDEVFATLNRYAWSASWAEATQSYYAKRKAKGKSIPLHRQIMRARKGRRLDFVDGDTLTR
jgi:hypothetical protein